VRHRKVEEKMRIYGLKACDTCRKAAKELGAPLEDIRSTPLPAEKQAAFLSQFGEALVNKRSTTWRNLDDTERTLPPATLLARYPTLMKRPVIEDNGGALYLGWGAEVKARLL
jgi:arsenate reductase